MATKSVRDERVREFVPPTRVVWSVGARNADAALADDDALCVLPPGSSLLLDYGRERNGGVRLDVPTTSPKGSPRIRIRFGESVSEAMATPDQDHAIHDQELKLAWMGRTDLGETGFRFVRIDNIDPAISISLRYAPMIAVFRDLPRVGSFACDDPRISRVWETGADTVHQCLQEHVWDGIKRDRLVWIGDLHPEYRVAATVFGELDVVKRSLDYARDNTPLSGKATAIPPIGSSPWMNGISSYSLWWLVIHADHFRDTGNLAYLKEQQTYLAGLTRLILSQIDPGGVERLAGHRFLEWPTSRDKAAIDSGLQALVTLALAKSAELLTILGETALAKQAADAAARTRSAKRAPTESKQARALDVLAGRADASQTNREHLAVDPFRGLSTFYGYYILQARGLAGDTDGGLDLLRNYWGAMLDLGATTFWEGFELDWATNAGRIDEMPAAGQRDLHAECGDYCYVGHRHSLCHGWAAGPTAWLSEHVLGIVPTSPGFATVAVRPSLGKLAWASGTIPTPRGTIEVAHEKRPDGTVHTAVKLPDGIRLAGR